MIVSTDIVRQNILDQAMRGELVEQNPNDEPAEVLFAKIIDEKTRLFREGRLKRQKPLPPIQDDEIPYDLPKGWKWVRLNDVFDVRDGTHDTPKYHKEGIPLVTSKNISTGKLVLDNVQFITYEDHLKISERSKVEKNDILFAMIGSIGNPTIIEIEPNFSIKNVALFKYYNINLSCPKYLYYYLQKVQYDMKKESTGGVQSFVSLSYLRSYQIPLPPIDEQKRIVKKIESLFRLCDEWEKQTEKQLNYLSALREKILDDALRGLLVEQNKDDESAEVLLGKIREKKNQLFRENKMRKQIAFPSITNEEIPYELPRGWQWVRLGEYSYVNMGQSPPSTSYNDVGDGLPFYQGKKDFGVLYPTPTKWCTEPIKIAEANDILLSVRAPVGQVNLCPENSCIGRGLASIKTIIGDFKYTYYVLKAKEKEIEKKGTGTTFKAINSSELNKILIPIPPLEEQHRIVEKIEKVFTYIDKLESSIVLPR